MFYTLIMIYLNSQYILGNKLVYRSDEVYSFIDGRIIANFIDSRRVGLVFCDLRFSDSSIRKIMAYNIPVIVGISGGISMDYENRENVTILVITNSETSSLTVKCVSSIPKELLIFTTTLIIYDTSPRCVPSSQIYWQYLGSANVLYLTSDQCWQVSPPYIFNRTFSIAKSCYIWNNHVRTPDMQGQTIEVVTFHRPLSTIINFNETVPAMRYDGMEMNIFIEIARHLNLSWRINELDNEINKYGQLINGHWVGGLMEALTNGTAQVGFSTIWESPAHISYLDFTTSWMTASTVFLVPRPTMSSRFWVNLIRPFSGPVWFGVGLLIVFLPLVAWTVGSLHYFIDRKQVPKGLRIGYIHLSFLYSLTGGSKLLKNQKCSIRFLVFSWLIFVLLMSSGYTCNIVAHITLPSFTPNINSVQQMVQENFSWGRPLDEDLSKLLDFQKDWHRKFAKNFRVYSRSDQRELIKSKKFALLAERIDSSHNLILDIPLEEDLAEMLRVMKEPIRTYRCAIALRKHSPLIASFNELLQLFIESGLVLYFKDDSVRRFQNGAYDKMHLDTLSSLQPQGVQPLNMRNFKFLFNLLLLGWALSSFFFILELYLGFQNRSQN